MIPANFTPEAIENNYKGIVAVKVENPPARRRPSVQNSTLKVATSDRANVSTPKTQSVKKDEFVSKGQAKKASATTKKTKEQTTDKVILSKGARRKKSIVKQVCEKFKTKKETNPEKKETKLNKYKKGAIKTAAVVLTSAIAVGGGIKVTKDKDYEKAFNYIVQDHAQENVPSFVTDYLFDEYSMATLDEFNFPETLDFMEYVDNSKCNIYSDNENRVFIVPNSVNSEADANYIKIDLEGNQNPNREILLYYNDSSLDTAAEIFGVPKAVLELANKDNNKDMFIPYAKYYAFSTNNQTELEYLKSMAYYEAKDGTLIAYRENENGNDREVFKLKTFDKSKSNRTMYVITDKAGAYGSAAAVYLNFSGCDTYAQNFDVVMALINADSNNNKKSNVVEIPTYRECEKFDVKTYFGSTPHKVYAFKYKTDDKKFVIFTGLSDNDTFDNLPFDWRYCLQGGLSGAFSSDLRFDSKDKIYNNHIYWYD